jgi:hypothetical protein
MAVTKNRSRLQSIWVSNQKYIIWLPLAKTALFFVLCFLSNAVMRAADTPSRLDIQVQANGFGNVSPYDISAVLQSAANEIWRHCPRTQLSGIDVYHRTDHPQTDFRRTPTGRIAIGLTAADTHWAQFAFQFGTSSAIRWQTAPITPASLSVIPLRPTSGWRKAFAKRLLCSLYAP